MESCRDYSLHSLLITIMHDFLQVDYHSQQCHCGVSKSGGLELGPPGVLLVDPSGQNLLSIVALATTLGVHHLEEEEEKEEEDWEGGQSHMLIMV